MKEWIAIAALFLASVVAVASVPHPLVRHHSLATDGLLEGELEPYVDDMSDEPMWKCPSPYLLWFRQLEPPTYEVWNYHGMNAKDDGTPQTWKATCIRARK